MKSSIKWVIFIGLLAALFVIAACVPPEAGKEEGALAGQATKLVSCTTYNQQFVNSCSKTGSTVTVVKQAGGTPETYTTPGCTSDSTKKTYSCPNNKRFKTCTYTCTGGQTCQNGVCKTTTSICGNNVREGNEVCDGTALVYTTCASLPSGAYESGTLACQSNCQNYDIGGCVAVETCNGIDDNNNGQVDETGCWACGDSDLENNPTVGGTVTLTSPGQEPKVFADGCKSNYPELVNETICIATSGTSWWNLWNSNGYVNGVACPEDTTCQDQDGIGPIPAVCQ